MIKGITENRMILLIMLSFRIWYIKTTIIEYSNMLNRRKSKKYKNLSFNILIATKDAIEKKQRIIA
jgi:hypothetical protein